MNIEKPGLARTGRERILIEVLQEIMELSEESEDKIYFMARNALMTVDGE